jgi:hypothetical protein
MFILNQGKPEIEPKMLIVPEFKALWNRDKSANKARATKELAYIYFVGDYKSEYNTYGLEKRNMVALEIMGSGEWEPDELVTNALIKYEAMQQTYSMRYLKSVRNTVDSLMKFYNELQFKAGQQNILDYDPVPVTRGLKEIEIILEKIEKWERKVTGEEDMMQIRGGGKVGLFEDNVMATWIKKTDK